MVIYRIKTRNDDEFLADDFKMKNGVLEYRESDTGRWATIAWEDVFDIEPTAHATPLDTIQNQDVIHH